MTLETDYAQESTLTKEEEIKSLFMACSRSELLIIRRALNRHKELINIVNAEGRTLLITACVRESHELALFLIKFAESYLKFDDFIKFLNKIDNKFNNALHYTLFTQMETISDILINKGIDIDVICEDGLSAFHSSCRYGLSDIAIKILKTNDVDINQKDSSSNTTMMWICKHNLINVFDEVIKKYLDNEKNNIIDLYCVNKCQRDALYYAVMYNDKFYIASCLLQIMQKKSIQICTFYRFYDNIIMCILKHKTHNHDFYEVGKDTTVKFSFTYTKLYNLLELFLIKFSSVTKKIINSTNTKHMSALHVLCNYKKGRYTEEQMCNLCELFIKAKVNLNIQNNKGITPLMLACQQGHIKLTYCLLKNGANISIKTYDTKSTALDYAQAYHDAADEDYEILKELKYLTFIHPFLIGTKDKKSSLFKPFQSALNDTKIFQIVSSFI